MKKSQLVFIILLSTFISVILFSTSCDNAKTPEFNCTTNPTYDVEIAPIINNKCATIGCHVSGGPQPNNILNNYEGLQPYLNSDKGGFRDQVVDTKEMPIGSDLTETEFELVKCWVQSGYPKN